VLTQRCAGALRTTIDNATTRLRHNANGAQNRKPTIDAIAGNGCAAIVSDIRASIDRHHRGVIATGNSLPKARCVDSESHILATKKFSCSPPSRLIGARQNRIFARIAAADSQARFSSESTHRPSW
jgi:hypothetical protein